MALSASRQLSGPREPWACDAPEDLEARARLAIHAAELERWNARMSLIGPGSVCEVLDRHFGESLAALDLLPEGPGECWDLGSGAGFPGLVLAAARPDLRWTLVEPDARKRAFLVTTASRMALSVRCSDARISFPFPESLPAPFLLMTSRALRLSPETWSALGARLDPSRGSILRWTVESEESPPAGLVLGRVVPLGGERRRLVEWRVAR